MFFEEKIESTDNEWPNTNIIYADFIRGIKRNGKEELPNYGDFFGAILTDLCMPEPVGLTIESEQDFVNATNLMFPKDSKAFEWSRRVIGLKILGLYKNEFIACKEREGFSNDSKILWRLRAELEYNPEFIQIIAVAIPFIRVGDQYIFLFVKESLSDMAGHTTMIGGHVRYSPNISSMTFDSACNSMAQVEFCEETGLSKMHTRFGGLPDGILPKDVVSTIGAIKFNTVNEVSEDSISHYHVGYGYPLQIVIPPEQLRYMELEEGKEIVLWTPNALMTEVDFRDSFNHPIPVTIGNEILSKEFNVDNWVEFLVKQIMLYSNIYYEGEHKKEG